jgi:hypothetical protein
MAGLGISTSSILGVSSEYASEALASSAMHKFEGLHHFMGEGLLKYLSFKMKVYSRNCLLYIISVFQYENPYYEFWPHPFTYK